MFTVSNEVFNEFVGKYNKAEKMLKESNPECADILDYFNRIDDDLICWTMKKHKPASTEKTYYFFSIACATVRAVSHLVEILQATFIPSRYTQECPVLQVVPLRTNLNAAEDDIMNYSTIYEFCITSGRSENNNLADVGLSILKNALASKLSSRYLDNIRKSAKITISAKEIK